MGNQAVPLTLRVHMEAGADDEEQAMLIQRLRQDILELDVDAAGLVRMGSAPTGAKGDPVTLSALAVTLAPTALTALMNMLQAWVSRRERASVTIETGSDKIVVTGTPSSEQQRMIDAFVGRYKASGGR